MWNDENKVYFSKNLEAMGLEATDDIINSFNIYSDMLVDWNKNINLTAITEDREIILKHFIDSLTILPYIDCKKGQKSIIDVGTGAGFPGIPLKIVEGNLKVTLLDSLEKRVNFLNAVIEKINLSNINYFHGRSEDFGRDKSFREQYDYCTARAVAKLPVLLEYCLPFVKVDGTFIAMKGSDIQEIDDSKKALSLLGGEISQVNKVFLPDENIERNIIIIKKVRHTSTLYPRKAGKPTKSPLI